MPGMGHMYPDLMRAPCFQPTTHQGRYRLFHWAKTGLGLYAGYRVLAAIFHHAHALSVGAVPRDIASEVGEIEEVYLYDIDTLEQIANEGRERREAQIKECNAIIEVELRKMGVIS